MKFSFTQDLETPFPKVVAFFSDVVNLEKISPPYPRLSVVSDNSTVVKGAEFVLNLEFGLFSFRWVSVIEQVVDGASFTDTFRGSLFRLWRHTHRFYRREEGSRIVDEIECMPVLWFRPFAWFFVRMLFRFRRNALRNALK